MRQIKNRGYILFSIVNSIFIASQIIGFSLAKNPDLKWNAAFILILIAVSVVAGSVLGIFGAWLLGKRLDLKEEARFSRYEDGWLVEGYRKLGEPVKDPSPPASIAWLIILLAYLPGFLAYYPGICSEETNAQLSQMIAGNWSGPHLFYHTAILSLFKALGVKIGNPTTGIAIYSAVVLLALSGAFAYCINIIKKLHCGKVWYFILTGFGALFPYSMFLGMSVTRDGLFAALFLPTLVLLIYFFRKKREDLVPEKEDIVFIILAAFSSAISPFSMCAQGIFILVVLVVMIVHTIRKDRENIGYLRIFMTTVTGFIIALVMVVAAALSGKVSPGEKTLMLGIPVQQVARTVEHNIDEMIPRDMEVVDSIIMEEGWRKYTPATADPVSRYVDLSYAKEEPLETFRMYMHLFRKYPGEYLNAYFAKNAGYLYVFDRSCLSVDPSDENGSAFIKTEWSDEMYGHKVVKAPAVPGLYKFFEKIVGENIPGKIPVLGILFVPGYVFWAFVYLGVSCWYRKKYRLILPIMAAVIFITMLLAGPAAELSAIYPVWAFLPFAAAVIYRKKNK